MAWEGKKVLAVVPARGGSKGIHRKNLKSVGGMSLVARAAQVALALPWLDEAIVSTDDDEILAEAVAHGLEAPFVRPPELSGDGAASVDMWCHAWTMAEAHFQCEFDISLLLEPTSLLRTADDVERTLWALIDGGHRAAATVSPTPAHYTPHKTLTVDDDGAIGFFLDGGAGHALRQSIPQFYHRNGICYAVTREALLNHGEILERDCAAVVIDRPVVNIDEPFEIELAEFMLGRQADG